MLNDSLPLPAVPYRGIEPYRLVDHRIFFARRAETLALQRSVAMFKGTILFGGSGSGKSSLLNAGLIPVILDLGLVPDRIRVQNRPDGEIIIERVSINDDEKAPFLKPSLADLAGRSDSNPVVLSLAEFKERLQSYASKQEPLLIFDQFEEIITLFEEVPHSPGALTDALALQARIIEALVAFLHDDSLRVKVLFAFREDYLAKLTKLFLLAPELPNQSLRLTWPQKKSLRDIIARPLEEERRKHYERKQTFSEGLISQLIEKFTLRSEGDAINLSEVQIVCLELWETPDPDALFKSRGVEGILVDYLEKELSEFSDEQRGLAIGLLSHMLTTNNTRNFISGEDLIKIFQSEEPISTEQLMEALRALTRTRLVRRELRYGDYFYEITSEFLVPWLIEKKTKRQSSLERSRLEEEKRIELEHEDARRKTIFWRLASIAFAAIMLLLLAVSWIIIKQERTKTGLQAKVIQAQKDAAAEQALNARIIKDILPKLYTRPQPQIQIRDDKLKAIKSKLKQDKLGGIQLLSSLIQEGQFPPELVPSLVSPVLTARNAQPEVAQAARGLLAQATKAKDDADALKKQIAKDKLDAIHQMGDLMRDQKFPRELLLSLLLPALTNESDPDVTSAASNLIVKASVASNEVAEFIINTDIAERLPPRVYILMESEKQSQQANSIKTALENNGFIVPNTEIVDIRAPRRYELRYYRQDDEKKMGEIVALLSTLKLNVTPVYLKGYENSTQARPGHFELWFAAQSKRGEDWYVIVRYSPATKENRTLVESFIATVTENEGGTSKPLSARELSVGPYSKEQAENVRQQLSENNIDVIKKVGKIRH